MIVYATLILFASSPADGWTNSGSMATSAGWDSNPLRLQETSPDSMAGVPLRVGGRDELGWRRGGWLVRTEVALSTMAVPGMDLAGDDEIRLDPSMKLSSGRGLRPWVEVSGRLLASDNSLMIGAERFDPHGKRQGEFTSTLGASIGVRPREWGRFALDGRHVYRDFEELGGSTSLDRTQWEGGISWDGPSWNGIALEAACDAEDRQYRSWPARYRWGDAAPGVAKHLTTWGGQIGMIIESGSVWKIRLRGRWASRLDRDWGYLDERMPSFLATVRWNPDSSWSLQARVQEGWEIFARYHDGYDPTAGLKRIRSHLARLEIARSFGSRSVELTVQRTREVNTNARYTWTSWALLLGLRQEFRTPGTAPNAGNRNLIGMD